MQTTNERPFQIVAAMDVSPLANQLLEQALAQAHAHAPSEVHLLTVSAKDEPSTNEMLQRHLEDLAHRRLRAGAGGQAPLRLKLHVRPGDAAAEIVDLVFEVEADLLLIGGPTSKGKHPHLSKVTTLVLERVPCPVIVTRRPDYGPHPLRAKQCPACVAVRAESNGERWFCEQHSGRGSVTSSVLMPHAEPSLGGGLML